MPTSSKGEGNKNYKNAFLLSLTNISVKPLLQNVAPYPYERASQHINMSLNSEEVCENGGTLPVCQKRAAKSVHFSLSALSARAAKRTTIYLARN